MGQLWVRSQYLKNAVLWYNSCEDYLLQIIWFAFDFFDPHKLTTQAKYKKLLQSCRWESLLPKLEARKDERLVNSLLEKINEFRSDSDVKDVRKIANSLKHHADMYIKDLDLQPDYVLNDDKGFTSHAVENRPIDIDEASLLLQKVHQKVAAFSSFLHGFIDFEKPFENDEKGVIHLDNLKSKIDYKKFFIYQ